MTTGPPLTHRHPPSSLFDHHPLNLTIVVPKQRGKHSFITKGQYGGGTGVHNTLMWKSSLMLGSFMLEYSKILADFVHGNWEISLLGKRGFTFDIVLVN
ncbi:hypothetical protein L2E82_29275 [Cichorium intybus]|uniref:Uncharacterized protein n=1 Tax=Cichorium intybus TaxID=13427 RepID=A0ACB9CXA9_CICIN|nr:hypothetical protein L2E82_29275 [Cichorium intybus]